MAYDRTRVVLDMMNGDPDTTYINGNWIDGYKQKNAYIAAQGPVPNSFISHWRMIWQYNIETIVMVTHEVEGNRMKCHRYVLPAHPLLDMGIECLTSMCVHVCMCICIFMCV